MLITILLILNFILNVIILVNLRDIFERQTLVLMYLRGLTNKESDNLS